MSKKSILSLIIAFVIALVITVVVRWIIPVGNASAGKGHTDRNELSMPEIPLIVKEAKERNWDQILISSKDIKKEERIVQASLSWKKWPQEAMQSDFIAKDERGRPINDKAAYENALKMWAAGDIPAGVPVVLRMLTNEDPVKKRQEETKKKTEEQRKKEAASEKISFIRKGMRAVTFSIDQRSAVSLSMLSVGDYVDILVSEHSAGKNKIYKYRALKILAIDGSAKAGRQEPGIVSGISSVGGLVTPKNVTLEVKEDRVEEMLRRAGNAGVILSLRSQSEDVKGSGDAVIEEEEVVVRNALLKNIADMSRIRPTEVLQESKKRRDEEEKNLSMLMSSMNTVGGGNSADVMLNAHKLREAEERSLSMIMKNINAVGIEPSGDVVGSEHEKKNKRTGDSKDGKYEIVSGKIVGEEEESPQPEENFVTIYRKLKADEIQFDEQGKKLDKRAIEKRIMRENQDKTNASKK